MTPIILYDLPSKDGTAWSINPWKTRLALNFKGLPYTTEWLERPEIAPRLKALGIAPNTTDPETPFTVPTISVSSTHHIMDSAVIAAYLEASHPDPAFYPDAPEVAEVEAAVDAAFKVLGQINVWSIPRNVLTPHAAEQFEKGFKEGTGMTTEEYAGKVSREQVFERAKAPWEALAGLLNANGGPFVLGVKVSYADLHIVAWMECCKRIDAEVFQRILASDEGFAKVYAECEKWVVKDD